MLRIPGNHSVVDSDPLLQVGANWAVTAAHCVYNEEAEGRVEAATLSLVLGVHDRSQLTPMAKLVDIRGGHLLPRKVPVSEVIIHEEYNITSGANDLAMVKLGARVSLSTFPPACLPGVEEDFTGSSATVSGECTAGWTGLMVYRRVG